jgi:hypothetical protein
VCKNCSKAYETQQLATGGGGHFLAPGTEDPRQHLLCVSINFQPKLAYLNYSFYFAPDPTPLTTLSPNDSVTLSSGILRKPSIIFFTKF